MSNSTHQPSSTPYTHTQENTRQPGAILAQIKTAMSFSIKVAVVMLLIWILATPIVALVGYFGYFQMFSLILPRVQVGDTRLGGMQTYDAAVHLNKAWNMERNIVVGTVLAGEIQTWDLPPETLGLNLDPIITAQHAMNVGHGQNPFAEFDQFIKSLIRGWQVSPVVIFNPEAVQGGLESLAAQTSIPPRNASFTLQAGRLIPIPSEPGYAIDIEKTLEKISVDPNGVFNDGYLLLEMKTVQPEITDVSTAMAEAQRLLDTAVSFSAYDPISDEHFNWQVPRDIMRTWVILENTGGTAAAAIDEGQVLAYLGTLSDTLGDQRYLSAPDQSSQLASAVEAGESITLTIRHPSTTYVVQPGDTLLKLGWQLEMPFWKILEANPDMDANNLSAGQTITIPSRDELLPLPVIPNKRIVISISQQHLWAYEDGALLAEYVISTGVDRSPTQPGVFQVQTHEPNAYASVWDLYMPNFLGIYEAWPGFMNGLHGLPTLSSGRQLWRDVLGSPASYGCIILDIPAAEFLYTWAEDGVVVEIQP
jgi:lipoprotein-anchoring transpeptidase ErfK/SrfK